MGEIFPLNCLSHANDYIIDYTATYVYVSSSLIYDYREPMVTFTAWVKIYSSKYF